MTDLDYCLDDVIISVNDTLGNDNEFDIYIEESGPPKLNGEVFNYSCEKCGGPTIARQVVYSSDNTVVTNELENFYGHKYHCVICRSAMTI